MKDLDEIYPDKMLRGISSFAFIEQGILQDDVFNLDPLDSSKNGSYLLSSIWGQQSNDKDDKKNGGPFFAF